MSTTTPIAWNAYPHEEAGCYAYLGNLTMTAHPSGSWNVWEKPGTGTGRTMGSCSTIIPDEEQNLSSAKEKAEEAARNFHTKTTKP